MSPAAATRAPLPPTLAREKLTREATVIVAVLVVSTFTVILNEMLMVIPCLGSWRISTFPPRPGSG
jgi:hypothetical protein